MSFRLTASTALTALCLSAAPTLAQDQPVKPAAPVAKPAAPAAKPAPAPAGAQAGAANTTPAISGPQPDWVKLCSNDPQTKKDICQTSRDLRAETGQTLASVAVREDKGGKRILIMAIPPGMQIQPGVRVVVDQQAPVMGRFSVCFPNVCLVETEATDTLIASLKKGTTLNLQALNVQARGVVFPIGLAGFGKAFDGDPLDPKVYQSEQKKLSDMLAKKAQDEAKKLNETPAPAPQ
jgi:invasion protein IalB